jgi:hypothetical protein
VHGTGLRIGAESLMMALFLEKFWKLWSCGLSCCLTLWVVTSSEEPGAAIFRVQVSGAGIGVSNVGRMEGFGQEGKSVSQTLQ